MSVTEQLEKMADFFAARVHMYDEHMLEDVGGCKEGYVLMSDFVPENAKKLGNVEDIVQEFLQTVLVNCKDVSLDEAVKESWECLKYHGVYCTLLSKALAKRAEGDFAAGKKILQELVGFVRSNELRLQKVLDVFEFQEAVAGRLKWE